MSKTQENRILSIVSSDPKFKEIQGIIEFNTLLKRNSKLTKTEEVYTYEFNVVNNDVIMFLSRCLATNIYSKCITKMLSMYLDANEIKLSEHKFDFAQIALFDAMQNHFSVTVPLLSFRIANHFETKDRLNLDVYMKVNTQKIVDDGYTHISTNMNTNFYLMDMIYRLSSIDDTSSDASFLYASLLSRNIYFKDEDFVFDDDMPSYIYFERGRIVFGNDDVAFPITNALIEETVGKKFYKDQLSPVYTIVLAAVLLNTSVIKIYSSVGKSIINEFKEFIEMHKAFFDGYTFEYPTSKKPTPEVN